MLQRTYWVLSLLPILAGVGAGFTSFGPYLLVIVIAVCLNGMPSGRGSAFGNTVMDFLVCGAVLAYVVAHYRLQCLFLQVVPPDPRRRQPIAPRRGWRAAFRRTPPVIREKRSAKTVTLREIQRFLSVLPLWTALAVVLWRIVASAPGNPGLKPHVWQAVLLAWLLVLGVYVVANAVSYWHRRQMTVEQATLYLQDQLWAETRREQRRLNRWLVWGRRRPRQQENNL